MKKFIYILVSKIIANLYYLSFLFPGKCNNHKGLFMLKKIYNNEYVDEFECKLCGTIYIRKFY